MKLIQFDIELDISTERTIVKQVDEFHISETFLKSPEIISSVVREAFSTEQLADEIVFEIAFNTIFKPIGIFLVARGGVSSAFISVRSIFMRAMLLGASSIVILHNHPSGDPEASKADITSACKLHDAGKLLDVAVADFIVIGRDSYYSCAENHIFKN